MIYDFDHIFLKVFNCIPSDEVTNFQILQDYHKTTPLSLRDKVEAESCLKNVKVLLIFNLVVNNGNPKKITVVALYFIVTF